MNQTNKKLTIEHFAEAVRLNDKIEKMRKASKFLHGDKYPEAIKFYKDKLLDFQRYHKIEDLTEALIKMLSIIGQLENSESTTIHLTAAYAELVEPSI